MKNVLLGSIFTLIFLPQVSFAQTTPPPSNPLEAPCEQKIAVENTAFWSYQGAERGVFIKDNPTIIVAHDQRFKQMHDLDIARRLGRSTAGLPVPPDESQVFVAFQQKQQGDKLGFLAKEKEDMATCLAGGTFTPWTPPTGGPTGT